MSNLSPDFTLPINFCANPQDASDHSGPFLYRQPGV